MKPAMSSFRNNRSMSDDSDLIGLSRNWRDSLAHALSHFADLRTTDYGFHNRKWTILSVHHAAEVFCNFLLRRADAGYPPPNEDYLGLRRSLRKLEQHKVWATLTGSEQHVLTKLLPTLIKSRNVLMHEPAPEKLAVSEAALAVLALLVLVKRQTGASTNDFFSQSPAIELDVVDELRVDQLAPYTRFVEQVLAEEYGEGWEAKGCDYCGGQTIPRGESECRACFHESNTLG